MHASPPQEERLCLAALLVSATTAIGLWLFPVASARADIYKFVDQHGVTHVTNTWPADMGKFASGRAVSRPARPGTDTLITQRSKRYAEIVETAAREHQIDAALIHALIRAESNYNAAAVSPKGAIGLMQLMPATARRYGVADPRDATQNVQGGVRYLRDLLDLFHHNLALTLAAYNAGEGAVARHGGVPPFAETTNYVTKVLDFYLRPSPHQDLNL